MATSSSHRQIPLLLLKTRSTPHDAYEEFFSSNPFPPPSSGRTSRNGDAITATRHAIPCFIPVMEHQPNVQNLGLIRVLMTRNSIARGGEVLTEKYGGMIFTSQRAVEAWAGVVQEVDHSTRGVADERNTGANSVAREPGLTRSVPPVMNTMTGPDTQQPSLTPNIHVLNGSRSFPIYTVGPATSRALQKLVDAHPSLLGVSSRMPCSVLGSDTGNGATLASFILSHYNGLQRTPNEKKKPLFFLVGETRRDIIPKTLMNPDLDEDQRIQVDEMEVYTTTVLENFEQEYRNELVHWDSDPNVDMVVTVVFSPSGCSAVLRSLGLVDDEERPTEKAARRQWRRKRKVDVSREKSDDMADEFKDENENEAQTLFKKAQKEEEAEEEEARQRPFHLLATIGPTTRDHLIDHFGIEPDMCAKKPSPEGVRDAILDFLLLKSNPP